MRMTHQSFSGLNAPAYVFGPHLSEKTGKNATAGMHISEVANPTLDSSENFWSIRAAKAFYLRYRFVQHRFTATMLSIDVE